MSVYEVIIVGGGPTGVALGIELGLQNINTLILEKHENPLLSPRAQSLNPRSMEFFRRWKIADKLKKEILLSPDYPIRGVWCSALNGKTYATSSSNDLISDDISPERGIRIPLWLTEKVLRERLADFHSVTLLKEHNVTDVTFKEDNVTVCAYHHEKEEIFSAPIVVGCDGANSITRHKAGISFESLAPPQRVINVMFETKDLEKQITIEQGFLYYLLETDTPGAMGPVDLKQGLWYAQIRGDNQVNKIEDLNVSALLDKMVGFAFKKHIIQAHFWQMHVQMAHSFSKDNRFFLVGDSAHAFVPTGGFGLNTGLGDVTNLGWKLGQVIKGKSNQRLLESYESERRSVCMRNLKLAQKNADDLMSLREKYNPKENPEGFAKANAALANQWINTLEATLGYQYNQKQADISLQTCYRPIVAPGYFLPHRKLHDAESIYDKLSPTEWTLIVSGELPPEKLTSLSDFPGGILLVPENTYPFTYVLIRPDWHIVYAGNCLSLSDMLIVAFSDTHIAFSDTHITAWDGHTIRLR